MCWVATCWWCNAGFAQNAQIKGVVVSAKDNRPLTAASLILKTLNVKNTIAYTFTNEQGEFILNPNERTQAVLITRYLGYQTDTLKLDLSKPLQQSVKIALKESENLLKEVVVSAPIPITQKNDTTSYNVEKFTSLGDRTIEDVIKKLPGMEVDPNGKIKFKGKEISKLMLDGDDLTGQNYQKLTQVVKPEHIKEVKAIENFLDDVLLKDIVKSDEVALNLTLKKPSLIFGTISAAGAPENKYDVGFNLFTIKKKFKHYSLGGMNNTGASQNYSTIGIDDIQSLYSSKKNINHAVNGVYLFDNERFNINQSKQWYNNLIVKPNDNLKLDVGLNLDWDQFFGQNTNTQNYLFPQANTINNQLNERSRNRNSLAFFKSNYLYHNKSRLQFTIQYATTPEKYESNALTSFNLNPTDSVVQNQIDQQKFLAASLKFTHKFKNKTALISKFISLYAWLDQDYKVKSPLYEQLNIFETNFLNQTINQEILKNRWDIKIAHSHSDKHFWVYGFEFTQDYTQLNTQLFNQNTGNLLGNTFQNQSDVNFLSAKGYINYTLNFKKWNIKSELALKNYHIKSLHIDSNYLAALPSLSATYKFDNEKSINFSYKFDITTPNFLSYYNNYILTHLRSADAGIAKAYFFNKHSYSLGLNKYSFSKFTDFNVNLNYQTADRGFVNQNFFMDEINYNSLIPYKGMKLFTNSLLFKQYIDFLSSKMNINYTYYQSTYYGLISNTFNQYQSKSHLVDLGLNSGFILPINGSIGLKWQSQNINNQTIANFNRNTSIKYYLSIRTMIGKQYSGNLSYDYYDINQSHFQMLNFNFVYKPLKSKWSFEFRANNLLNQQNIRRVYLTEIVNSQSTSQIIGRFLLFGLSYKIN